MKPEDNETSNESERKRKTGHANCLFTCFFARGGCFLTLIYRSFLRGQDDFLFMDPFTRVEIEFVKDFGRRRRLFGGCFFFKLFMDAKITWDLASNVKNTYFKLFTRNE